MSLSLKLVLSSHDRVFIQLWFTNYFAGLERFDDWPSDSSATAAIPCLVATQVVIMFIFINPMSIYIKIAWLHVCGWVSNCWQHNLRFLLICFFLQHSDIKLIWYWSMSLRGCHGSNPRQPAFDSHWQSICVVTRPSLCFTLTLPLASLSGDIDGALPHQQNYITKIKSGS